MPSKFEETVLSLVNAVINEDLKKVNLIIAGLTRTEIGNLADILRDTSYYLAQRLRDWDVSMNFPAGNEE